MNNYFLKKLIRWVENDDNGLNDDVELNIPFKYTDNENTHKWLHEPYEGFLENCLDFIFSEPMKQKITTLLNIKYY